ncbi:hypothetical protein D3C77_397640 [compost metagenome]
MAPVRSPLALPSAPTVLPPQLVKVSGRLLQLRLASVLAILAPLGTSTEYTTLTVVPTSIRAMSTLKPPVVLKVTPAGRLPGP